MFEFMRGAHYRARLGHGRAVWAMLSDGYNPQEILIRFEKKIGSRDVRDGKLVPIAFEEVKKRGGKRSVSILLSPESAEALYVVLGEVLRTSRKRRVWITLWNFLFTYFSYQTHRLTKTARSRRAS